MWLRWGRLPCTSRFPPLPAAALAVAAGSLAFTGAGLPPCIYADDKKDKRKKKTLYVFLVRHAESENNANFHNDEPGADKYASGKKITDPHLTGRGQRQADATARFFKKLSAVDAPPELRPRRLFVSPMLRALETCRPIASATDLPPQVNLEIFERGGLLEGSRHDYDKGGAEQAPIHGMSLAEMREIIPTVWCELDVPIRGWWRGGLETDGEMSERAKRCSEWLWHLAESSNKGESGAVVCVTHGALMNEWVQALMGLAPAPRGAKFPCANCCFHLFKLESDSAAQPARQVVLVACNESGHLLDADYVPQSTAKWRF